MTEIMEKLNFFASPVFKNSGRFVLNENRTGIVIYYTLLTT